MTLKQLCCIITHVYDSIRIWWLYKSVTGPPEQRRNRYKQSLSYQRHFSSFIMSKVHNSSSKDDDFSQMNQAKILTSTMGLSLILSSDPYLSSPSGLFLTGFQLECCAHYHIIHATCPDNFTLPDFVTVHVKAL